MSEFGVRVACQQALHLGDIVKSTRARGTREETRLRGVLSPDPRGFAARSRVLVRLVSLAQIGELARRLLVDLFSREKECAAALRRHRDCFLFWRETTAYVPVDPEEKCSVATCFYVSHLRVHFRRETTTCSPLVVSGK